MQESAAPWGVWPGELHTLGCRVSLSAESVLLLEELGRSVQDLKLPLTFSVKFFQEADFVALHVQ